MKITELQALLMVDNPTKEEKERIIFLQNKNKQPKKQPTTKPTKKDYKKDIKEKLNNIDKIING